MYHERSYWYVRHMRRDRLKRILAMIRKAMRSLLVWTWASCLCGGVASALRFATYESQDEVLEGESRLLTAVQLETDGAVVWNKELVQLLISCQHGTLQLDRDVERSLVGTAFLCEDGDAQVKRSIGALTTQQEAQQILSSIVYQPDANYRSAWTDPLPTTEAGGNEVVRIQLLPVNIDAPRPSKDTCVAGDMVDISTDEAGGSSAHEKKIFVKSVNDPQKVGRESTLELKYGGSSYPPDMLIREAIMAVEDMDMLIGGEINLDAFADIKVGSTIGIRAHNGVVYSVGDGIHMDANSEQQISTNDIHHLRSVMSNLRYIPNPDFNGIDEIGFSAQGQASTLYIYVQAENDPPRLDFDSSEMNDWYKYPRMFLPSFQLDDPDKDQTYQVDIRVDNGTFFVEQMSTSVFDGVSVEINSSPSSLRLTSGLARLNTLFQHRLVEIVPKSCLQGTAPTSCKALIEVCADDGFISTCEVITLPEQEVFYHVVVSSWAKSLNVTAGGSLNISEAFMIHQRFDVIYELLLRVQVSSSFFRIAAPSCGELRNLVRPVGRQDSNQLGMTQLVYSGDAACLNRVLGTIQLQTSYGSNSSFAFRVELLTEEMRLLANESVSVDVAEKPTPIHISVLRTSGDDPWVATPDSYASLTSIVNVSLVADPEAIIGSDILELKISCQNCLWKYRSFVPQVSYERAQIPSSGLSFLGSYEALRTVLATLQLTITNRGNAAEVIHLHMAPAPPLSRQISGSDWNSSTNISIPFTLHSSGLSWKAERTLMLVKAPDYTVALSGVKLTGKDETPSMNLTVRMNCTLGHAKVSLPRASPKLLELLCGPDEPAISLVVERAQVNDVVHSTMVKMIPSGRDSRVRLHITAVETAQKAIAKEASIDLDFRASQQLAEAKFALSNESSVIHVTGGKIQSIGDILTVAGNLDGSMWFRMLAHVNHGRLTVPMDVCCVDIRETKHENEVDMIGTAVALQRALATVQFQGHELYYGRDLLEVTFARFPSATQQPHSSFDIPIHIVSVGHASTKMMLASVNDNDVWATNEAQIFLNWSAGLEQQVVIPCWSQPSDSEVSDAQTNDEAISFAPDSDLFQAEHEVHLSPKTTALVPLIHIEESIEGPLSSQYWEIITLALEVGRSWSISGIYIRDGSGDSSVSDDDLTLNIDAEIGTIFLDAWDGLEMSEGSESLFTEKITVTGKLDLINTALLTLRYQCSGSCNRQDTVTFQVRNPLAPPPKISHTRSIKIDQLYDVPVPFVATNASLYYSTEDAAFQFPELTFRFADENASLQAMEYIPTEQHSQLWGAELSYRSAKYSYPRSRSDDKRHRFVAEFSGKKPPRFMCQMGNLFYFAGSDGQHGEELWVSDGSSAGTAMVVDLLPGREGSTPADLVTLNGKLVFTAAGIDLTTGREMWTSDGSAKQTSLIADIRPGPASSNPQYYTLFQSQLLLFQAETDEFGVELYKTDGTKTGTTMVEDIWRGPRSSNPKYFVEWTAADGRARMYFAATSDSGRELWVSDALSSFNSDRNRKPSASNVAVGTFIVRDICAGEGSSSPRYLVAAASVGIFFSASDCDHGRELWFTDGSSTGTRMVKDLNIATDQGSNPTSLVVFGGKVYFQAQADPSIGRELYVSDGTSSGTTLLIDLVPGPLSSAPTSMSVVGPVTMTDGTTKSQGLLFTAVDTAGRTNVWLSDGTAQGTAPLLDEVFLLSHNLSFRLVEQDDRTQRVLEFGNAIYFATHDFSPGRTVTREGPSTLYQLDVRVSYGLVFIVSSDDMQQMPDDATNELKLGGTVVSLKHDLDRMAYLPPQNWNDEQFPGGHIVEWQFVVSYENKSVETYADLVITARFDISVIAVPEAIEDPSHYMGDYLSVLRLECLPLVCDEDSPMQLDGFSVRAADVTPRQLSTTDLLVLSISVSHGVLSLGDPLLSNCIGQFVGPQSQQSVSFQANVDCMNRILSGMTYAGEPHFSGSDQLKIRVGLAGKLDVGFDEVIVPIIVLELNDAPYIDVRSVYYEAVEDIPLVIEDLYLRDPDALEEPLRVVMEASCGQLALLRPDGIDLTAETMESGAMRLTLKGTLFNLNAAIASVVYTSAKDWNSLQFHSDGGLNGFDIITINAFDSSSFNASSVSVLFIYVDPDVDSVVIDTPSNVLTSVYADDPPGMIRGDEDTWIGVNGLAFSSVDDTAQMTLVLSLSVAQGILSLSQLRGITFFEGTSDHANIVKIKGTFANVNGCVAGLRYIPYEDYYGKDSLLVTAYAIDQYTQQQTPSSSISIAITIDPVNDAPVWNIGSSVTRGIQQGRSASIAGVYLRDVDVAALDCAVESCVMDLIVEASQGFVTLSDQSSASFSNDMTIKKAAYVVVSGTPDELNTILSKMTFELAEPKHYRADSPRRTDIKLQLTVDDRGTFGRGGPQISTTTMIFNPVTWSRYALSILAPEDVLEIEEDTTFKFNGNLQLLDSDSARSFDNLLELKTSCTSGVFALSSQATGIQVLRNDSDGDMVIRGYFAQLNAGLNGSSYIPAANWYGSEKLSLSVVELNHLEQKGSAAVATVFLFVAPVCDEPQWRSQQPADKPFSMKEDGYLLIDSISLTNPDLDDEQREVEVSIGVKHGGIMLSMMKGLLVEQAEYSTSESRLVAQHAPPGNTYSRARLFFKELAFRGRVSDINSALKGMIYKPSLDFNSDGWPVDEISLTATTSCGGTEDSSTSVSSATIAKIAIDAINDAPVLISEHFQRISWPFSLRALDAMSSDLFIEAVEGLPLQLETLELYDPDYDLRDGDLRLLVNVSCIHCTITSTEHQSTDDLVFLTKHWKRDEDTQLIVHGSLSSLNQNMVNQLTFRGADNFNGIAFVLVEISDLGNYGEGSEQHTLFALGVDVKAVNDIPQIHLPQFQSQESVLQLDEDDSVLIVGAPALFAVSEGARHQLPEWSLMSADLAGNESTTRLYSLNNFSGPKGIAVSSLVAYNGGLLFSGQGPDLGEEIWYSDGTAVGTVLLKDIFPGSGSSNPSFLTPFSKDNRVYFAAEGPHLSWQIEDIYRDSCQGFRPSSLDPDIYFTVAAVNVWDPEETYDCPLGFRWMSTSEAQQVFLGTIALDGHSEEPLTYFDQCGWRGYDWGGQARKYFRFSDSKATGAFKHAGFRDSYRLDTGFQTDSFAGIVCYRESSSYQVSWGTQLWATDGTEEGTQRVARISTDPEGSNPSHFVELNQRLYFQATSPDFGSELWSTDGSRAGTYLVADVEFGSRSSEPRFLTVFDSRVYFSAETQDYGRELWFSNGDPRFKFDYDQHATVGTGLVLDICPGAASSSPQHFAVLTSLLLFQADDCIHGPELWSTDGTRSGTTLVLDIHTGSTGSFPRYLTTFAGQVYFQADDGVHGSELWTTDGTPSGTIMLLDIAPGVQGSVPSFLTVLYTSSAPSGTLVFAAQAERDRLTELWQSDGTSGGTTKLFPQSREVVELNVDSLNLQLAGKTLVAISSEPDRFFYLGREISGQGVDFQRDATNRLGLRYAEDVAHTRSMTLEDVGATVGERNLTLSLSCSKGWLGLGKQCSGASVSLNGTPDQKKAAVVTLEGPLDALNCAVEKLTYHSKPQENGWDEIQVTLSQGGGSAPSEVDNVANFNSERDSSFAVSKRMRVEIRAINDPPSIGMASMFYAPLRQWAALAGIEIADPDSAEGMLYVSITVRNGRLRVILPHHINANGPTALHPTADGDVSQALEFATTAEQAPEIFTRLEYSCDDHYGCSNSQHDYLTVQVDDNGLHGAGGPQVATKTAEIIIVGI